MNLSAKLRCLLLMVLLPAIACAQDIVEFRLSKPYALINFLETCTDAQGTSYTLKNFAANKGLLSNSEFKQLLSQYRDIQLNYTWKRNQFPEHRVRSSLGTTKDLLLMAAVKANTLLDFRENALGILPNSDLQQLCSVLVKAEPYYDTLIWKPYTAKMTAHLAALQQYQPRITKLFQMLNHFYQSSWTNDYPFIVTIYPVPGMSGNTTASPYVNSLCVGLLTDNNRNDDVAGVVLHEMCHSLFNEQPATVQQTIEHYFAGDTSLYSSAAYSYIDEGLATACGNGWAREAFNGEPDKGKWYDDDYIDGFGRALYPLVKDYLTAGKAIDSAFIGAAIHSFAASFPKAPYDYTILLNSICLYSDAADDGERQHIWQALSKYYRVASFNSSSPIADAESLDMLTHKDGTQVVLVYKNHAAGMEKVYGIFPELRKMLAGKPLEDFIISYYDTKRRPIIIIHAANMDRVEQAFKVMSAARYIDPKQPYHTLD